MPEGAFAVFSAFVLRPTGSPLEVTLASASGLGANTYGPSGAACPPSPPSSGGAFIVGAWLAALDSPDTEELDGTGGGGGGNSAPPPLAPLEGGGALFRAAARLCWIWDSSLFSPVTVACRLSF